jgi:hypothetical protein
MSEIDGTQEAPTKESEHKAHILAEVCAELTKDRLEDASGILRERYPFQKFQNAGRTYSTSELLQLFFRDRFTDRYTGLPLVFPGTLRIISLRLPHEFPFHPNWKLDQCHLAYWELIPTLDHVTPVSRNGKDDITNWVTTSMVKNAAKANFTLEEIGWPLLPITVKTDWDGLTSWFSEEIVRNPGLLEDASIQK